MSSRRAYMLMVGVLVGLVSGCKEKTTEPVAQAPVVEQEPLPRFPESLVPKPETQPEVSSASPAPRRVDAPVDTGDTVAKPAAARTPQPKQHYAPTAAKATRTYVVQKGDTLQKISQKFYGTTQKWRRIHQANLKVLTKGPDDLSVGTKLTIP